MTRKFNIGEKVVLSTFQKTKKKPNNVRDAENYWRLIGSHGLVVSDEERSGMPRHEKGRRVLVQFACDINEYGLHCHNEQPNSLWIFEFDLEYADLNSK